MNRISSYNRYKNRFYTVNTVLNDTVRNDLFIQRIKNRQNLSIDTVEILDVYTVYTTEPESIYTVDTTGPDLYLQNRYNKIP